MAKYSSKGIREIMFCPVHKTIMVIDPATGKRKCAMCSGEVRKTTKEVPAENVGSSNKKRLRSASRRIEEEQDKSGENELEEENLGASFKSIYPTNESLLPLYLIDGRMVRDGTDKKTVPYLGVGCERGFKFYANVLDINKKDYSIEQIVDYLCDVCHKRKCTLILPEREGKISISDTKLQ